MTYIEQVEKISPKLAGIYLITNNVNGKHYVGQSIYLKKRLLKHRSNWMKKQYDNPLYRAFEKYGIDNFKIDLLWTTESTEYNNLKRMLDELEKKYIKEYNSYGEYNQTKGGDAGVLGLKMTEEQRKKIAKNGRYKKDIVYALNVATGATQMALNITFLLEFLGLPKTNRTLINNKINNAQVSVYKGLYVFGRS